MRFVLRDGTKACSFTVFAYAKTLHINTGKVPPRRAASFNSMKIFT